MIASANCPAACGELIRGWIQGGEKLVSCPIDCYNSVTITSGSPTPFEKQHMRRALLETLDFLGVQRQFASQLRLIHKSVIPCNKGMADSTADIAATILAVSRWLNVELSINDIAELCLIIEPTYSTLFPSLTLFDYLTGEYSRALGIPPKIDILLLEPDEEKVKFNNKLVRKSELMKDEQILNEALRRLERGCDEQDPFLIGDAATTSAICNQRHNKKQSFNKILSIAEQENYYGISVAHTGSVVGILFNQDIHDVKHLFATLKQQRVLDFYTKTHLTKMVACGVN